MEKKELIRALIALAEHEGSPIEFDVQFGHNGFVDPNGELVRAAKAMGVSFGDE